MIDSEKLRQFAHQLADNAREITLKYYKQPISIDNKQDQSPVSIADRECETLLRKMILETYPESGIYGEEFGVENLEAQQIWVIDPIDGTASFLTGIPLFGTLISVIEDHKPQLGLIDIPALDERWLGIDGKTYHNGRLCQGSHCTDLSKAKLKSTTPDMFNSTEWSALNHLSQSTKMRAFSGDSYNYGSLASGLIDLVVESDLKPYDYMAAIPVVEGAGGIITDWEGQALTINSGSQVIAAATPELHAKALAKLNENH